MTNFSTHSYSCSKYCILIIDYDSLQEKGQEEKIYTSTGLWIYKKKKKKKEKPEFFFHGKRFSMIFFNEDIPSNILSALQGYANIEPCTYYGINNFWR